MDAYPNTPGVSRTVALGHLAKAELIEELRTNGIQMNVAAERLLASDFFTTSEVSYSLTTIELTVRSLGFSNGATTGEIFERARELDISLCPLEVGPQLRLQFRDQEEGHVNCPVRKQRAPYGSLTIMSEIVSDDDDFPKGFYLRRIEGQLWLRGFMCDALHVYDADDRLLFAKR